MGIGAIGKRRSDRRNRIFEAYNKYDATTFRDKSCKICSQTFMVSRGTNSVKVSRYQIAHHMFSQHYGGEILNLLDVKQTSCEICGGKGGTLPDILVKCMKWLQRCFYTITAIKWKKNEFIDHVKVDIQPQERNVRRRSMDSYLQLKKPIVFGHHKPS